MHQNLKILSKKVHQTLSQNLKNNLHIIFDAAQMSTKVW